MNKINEYYKKMKNLYKMKIFIFIENMHTETWQ